MEWGWEIGGEQGREKVRERESWAGRLQEVPGKRGGMKEGGRSVGRYRQQEIEGKTKVKGKKTGRGEGRKDVCSQQLP